METGCAGPLPIFGPQWFFLFLAFMATKSPSLAIPSSWYAWQVAAQLYSAVKVVDKHLPGFGQKLAAKAAIERVLRAYKLPPATIKPWIIPPMLLKQLPQLRTIAKSGLQVLRNAVVRDYLCKHLRVMPGKIRRWTDTVNAKRILKGQVIEELRGISQSERERVSHLSPLRAHYAPWRLPVWQSKRQLSSSMAQS